MRDRVRHITSSREQRVTPARILAADPEMLLMDEPFAALNAMTRQQMQEGLLRSTKRTERTALFTNPQHG